MLAALFVHGILVVVFLGLFSRWLDEEISADVCLFGLVVELAASLFFVKYLQVTDSIFFLSLGDLFAVSVFPEFSLVLCFDEVSGFFFSILSFALLLCFFFLVEYFEYDANANSIIFLSSLFSQLAMLYFASFDLYLLFFFWESISFVSFFLIQHWAYRVASYKAGLKVFFISQLGDFFFFFFCFFLTMRAGTTDLLEIIPMFPVFLFEYVFVGSMLLNFVSLLAALLQVAVLLKAAQWFFYPWLLDAMEAPVPISAQLHSSTLVVIGFYLFFRFQLLFHFAPITSLIAVLAGMLTSIGASILGYFQLDGKKLLACSTAGQLGYVLVGLGLELYNESLALLTFCCCNKAMAFVLFGVLMRRFSGLSDFRVLAGSVSLAWFEHAFLVLIICNFTVFPGIFCWHVKGLFLQEYGINSFFGLGLGLGFLQLTWFFSSLYLWGLYLTLFFSPLRAQRSTNDTRVTSTKIFLQKAMTSIFFFRQRPTFSYLSMQSVTVYSISIWFLVWLCASMLCLLWATNFFGLFFFDLAWATSALDVSVTYF